MKKYVLCLGAFLLFSISSFADSFVSEDQIMYLNKNQEIGKVYKGTKVNVKNGKVILTGWVMSGNEYILFYSNTDRIKLARIDNAFIKNQVVKKTITDDYGVKWKQVALAFTLKNMKVLAKDTSKLWNVEKEKFQTCGACHNLHTPHEFSANQWPKMVKTMQANAGLTNKEVKNLSTYLQYEAIKGE